MKIWIMIIIGIDWKRSEVQSVIRLITEKLYLDVPNVVASTTGPASISLRSRQNRFLYIGVHPVGMSLCLIMINLIQTIKQLQIA